MSIPSTEKTCANCGETFSGRRNQIYCTSRCKTVKNNDVARNRNDLKRSEQRADLSEGIVAGMRRAGPELFMAVSSAILLMRKNAHQQAEALLSKALRDALGEMGKTIGERTNNET